MKCTTLGCLLLLFLQVTYSGELHRGGLLYSDLRLHPELKQVVPLRYKSGKSVTSSVDLSSEMPPVGNQGSQGSCVAWAMGYYQKTHTEWKDAQWVNVRVSQFSPAFIYNQINGGVDEGSYFSDAMKLIVDEGVANTTLSRYNQSNYTTWPTDSAYSYAIRYRGAQGYWIDCSDDPGIDLIKARLNSGYTAVLGINIWGNFDDIGSYDNTYCASQRTGLMTGGHAVDIVGYDDNRLTADGYGAFKLINSWGIDFGASGFFWMSYAAVKDPYLSQKVACYVTDRINYTPTLRARFRIVHTVRTTIGIRLGFGPPSSSRGTKDFFNWDMPTQANAWFPNNNIVVDLSDSISLFGPDSTVFLQCIDNASDGYDGTINFFSVERPESFFRTSYDPPVTIPDFGVYVYAQIPPPAFTVFPTSFDFGNLLVNSSKHDSMMVTNTGTSRLALSSVTSSNASFTVTPASANLAPSDSARFHITFAPSTTGPKSGNIVFSDYPAGSSHTVAVNGTGVQPAFSATTSSLLYHDVLVGSSKQDSVTVTNTGSATLNITNVSSSEPSFTVTPSSWSAGASASEKFFITFSPSVTGAKSGNIVFTDDAPGAPHTVSVSGTGVTPAFSISTSNLAYGIVTVGSSKQDTVTVTNNGTAALNISDVSSTNANFTVTPTSGSVAAGASEMFYITFSPASTEAKSGNIVFTDDAVGSPHTVSVTGTAVSIVVSYKDRWNLVSVPFTVSDSSKASLFPNAVSQALAYQGNYVSKSTLSNRVGYWLKFSSAQNIPFIGTPRTLDSVSVVSGWNLIGSISHPVPTSSITPLGTVIQSFFYGYDRRYFQADTISPGNGCWVKVTSNGQLVLDTSAHVAKTIAHENPLKNLNQLIVEDPAGDKGILYFSNDRSAVPTQLYELPPVPPAGSFDVRFSSQRMVEVFSADGEQEFPVLISSAEYPLSVHWTLPLQSANAELQIDNMRTTLGTNGSVKISKAPLRVALRIGGVDIPTKFALEQNYPNPFNPTTTIRFKVGEARFITLKIYDVLGRCVATLLNENKQSGTYSIVWDANNVPSGVYMGQLTSGSARIAIRMVLAK